VVNNLFCDAHTTVDLVIEFCATICESASAVRSTAVQCYYMRVIYSTDLTSVVMLGGANTCTENERGITLKQIFIKPSKSENIIAFQLAQKCY
jgi:hypothetical protein